MKTFRVGEQEATVIAAHGRGGQAIFVLPDQNAVVVLTAGHYDDNDAAGAVNKFVQNEILPELMSHTKK